jgi:hypothetical protein
MIYLCGITNKNEYQNIKELTDPIWEYVDGLIFGYDSRDFNEDDACYKLLQERKGAGSVILRPWTNDHDLQMNTFLREGPMKNGDWFILRDSMERINQKWARNIKEWIYAHDFNGIKSIFNYGKGFAFKWNDSMVFNGSPHWGLVGAQQQAIDIKNTHDESKKEITWRIKDGEEGGRPFDNKINHEAKYAWIYGRSNHLLLGLENQFEQFQRAEMIRQFIRSEAVSKGFDTNSLESLKGFIYFLKEMDYDTFKTFINSHRVWKNFYRYHFLNHNFQEIEKTENSWIL